MESEEELHRGKIVHYINKGFGFIEIEGVPSELKESRIFFHVNNYKSKNLPLIGEFVEFTIAKDWQGRREARNVTPVEEY